MTAALRPRTLRNPAVRPCLTTAPLTGRARLHVLDLDNLHATTMLDHALIHRVRDDYRLIGSTNSDLVFAACNHDPTGRNRIQAGLNFHVLEEWMPARVRLAHGPDGADHALLHDLEDLAHAENLTGRFEDVVIGSGDHAFAPVARRLEYDGLTVHLVVAQNGDLSQTLRQNISGCIWLLNEHRCVRHDPCRRAARVRPTRRPR
jgi:hypothetical protein